MTTLDVLSGGRAQLGIGAAWYEREHLGLGVRFPPVSERVERLEETLRICHQMWSDDDGPFVGRHYQLAETICSPRPIQRRRRRGTLNSIDSVDDFLAAMADYAAVGGQTVRVSAPPPDPAAWVEDFSGAVVPRLAEL